MAIVRYKDRARQIPRPSCSPAYSIVIDQRAGSDACLNMCGWPANEISLLMKLQGEGLEDSPLAKSLERSLFQLPTSQVDNSNLLEREIIERTIPRYVGTLSEYLQWVNTLPLSVSERELLDKQAKDMFNDDETLDEPTGDTLTKYQHNGE